MILRHAQLEWGPALEHDLRQLLRLAILEDLDRTQDITSAALVPQGAQAAADVVARDEGVIAGLQTGPLLLEEMHGELEWHALAKDGDRVDPNQAVAKLSGPALEILAAERIMLNMIGHLSGVATLTRKFVDQANMSQVAICDTRKTLPGYRRLEKYAVRCGGGVNHRMGLYDAVLIKDNHLAFGKQNPATTYTPEQAVTQCRDFVGADSRTVVQIEVDTLSQLEQVLPAAPDIVLLDNMACDQLKSAVAIRNQRAPKVLLEASGGVNLETIEEIAKTGVDRVSVGALTHSARQFDVGLDWR